MKVNIGGKLRPVQFGTGAIVIYCEKMDCDLEGLDYIATSCPQHIKAVCALVYAGIRNGTELEKETVDFTPEDVVTWIDELPQSEYNKILDAFKDSKMLGRTMADYFSLEPAGSGSGSKKKT